MHNTANQAVDKKAAIELAAALIEQADAIIVAAGAGMGIDSGLPDFRGKDGFWRAYPALRHAGLDFYSIASPQAFHVSPEVAWGFYGHRLALYRRTRPHSGFEMLKRWGERLSHGVAVFTSTVDGQFQKAGFDPALIHECHGSIHHLQCLEPCCEEIWRADDFIPDVDDQHCRLRNLPPVCPRCGGMARPNILMFNDSGWIEHRSAGQEARLDRWLSNTKRPVVIEVGAGTTIPSVRHFSHRVIQEHGGRLIRLNPGECDVPTKRDVGLPLGAAEGLALMAEVLGSPFG